MPQAITYTRLHVMPLKLCEIEMVTIDDRYDLSNKVISDDPE